MNIKKGSGNHNSVSDGGKVESHKTKRKSVKRRKLIKSLVSAGTGTTVVYAPKTWRSPVIGSVLLPVHATGTPNGDPVTTLDDGTSTSTTPISTTPVTSVPPPVCNIVCRVTINGQQTFTSSGTYMSGTDRSVDIDAVEFEVDPPGCITGSVGLSTMINGDAGDGAGGTTFDSADLSSAETLGSTGVISFGNAAYDQFRGDTAQNSNSQDTGNSSDKAIGDDDLFDEGFTFTFTPVDAPSEACEITITLTETAG